MREFLDAIPEERPQYNEGLGTKIKSLLGSKKAQGEENRNRLVNELIKEWNFWAGQTGAKGSMQDVKNFMTSKCQIKPEDVNGITRMAKVGAKSQTAPLSSKQITMLFDYTIRYFYSDKAVKPKEENNLKEPPKNVVNSLAKMGIDLQDIQDLSAVIRGGKVKFDQLDNAESQMVKVIGWAYLKSLMY